MGDVGDYLNNHKAKVASAVREVNVITEIMLQTPVPDIREHKYMTSEDFRGFGTIYHINHTAIRFCLTIRISIFNDVISLPILTDKNTFQTKANN